MSSAIRPIGFVACAFLSILALGTGVASAAGKPTSVEITNTHEVNGYTVLELTAKVNPNGAKTSTIIELREDGAEEKIPWTKGVTHELSGTTVRSYSEEFQVEPVKNYEARVKATNLFGTTVSTTAHEVSTHVRTTGEKELKNVPFASEGVATFAFTYASIPINVTCNEYSSGYIGNLGGKEDVYKYSMSGCATYINGEAAPECNVKKFTFTLSGPTLAVGNPKYIPLTPEFEDCAPGGYWQIIPKAFRVVDNGSAAEYSKGRSVSLTASASLYSSNPAEVTIESTWWLSAEYVETPFKIADIGL